MRIARVLGVSSSCLLVLPIAGCSNENVVAKLLPGPSSGGSGSNSPNSPDAGSAGGGPADGDGGQNPADGGPDGASPRCDDGVKNGDEVDVDCGGSCEPCACTTGLQLCTGVCVDLMSDTNHCGACDVTCTAGTEGCVSGKCVECRGVLTPARYLDKRGSDQALGARVADFDEDSHVDVLFTTAADGLRIKFGDGLGGFSSETALGLGLGGNAEVADLNADQHEDIVFITPDEKVIAAFGDGKGSFTPLAPMPVGVTPSAIAVADFNNDGRPDLAVANTGSSDVSLLFANSAGGFDPEVRANFLAHDYLQNTDVPIQLAAAPTSIAVGDLGVGGGNVDLIVTSDQGYQILSGTGTSTFIGSLSGLTEAISGMGSLTLADLDKDGFMDFVLSIHRASTDDPWVAGHIEVAIRRSGVTRTFYVAGSGGDVQVADIDHDGKLDIGAINSSSDTLDVLLGRGDGTFSATRSFGLDGIPFPATTEPANFAFADLNGDTRIDVVATGSDVETILNMDNTLFGQRAYPTIESPQGLELADVTGDGFLDALVMGGWGGNLVVHEGNASGVFGPAVRVTNYPSDIGPIPAAFTVGDFDLNGSLDLALCDFDLQPADDGVSIFTRTSGLTFESLGRTPWPSVEALVSADLDEDSQPDLISADGPANALQVRLGKPGAVYDTGTSYNTGNRVGDAIAADVNGDGHLDVVGSSYYPVHEITVFLGHGDGTLEPGPTTALDEQPLRIASADLNRDGHVDILVRYYQKFDVFLGDGKGGFSLFASHPDSTPSFSSLNIRAVPLIAVDDFSGDGLPDVAVTLSGGLRVDIPDQARVAIWRGTGDGGLLPPDYYPMGGGVTAIKAADLNRDGRPDLAVLCDYSNNLTVIMNQAVCR